MNNWIDPTQSNETGEEYDPEFEQVERTEFHEAQDMSEIPQQSINVVYSPLIPPGASTPQPNTSGPYTLLPVYKKVSGRYRSQASPWQIELRVDIDRFRVMKKISADFFNVTGSTTGYVGSMIVRNITTTTINTTTVIEGKGEFTFNTSKPKVKVSIPRISISSTNPNASATLQFFSDSGLPGASYFCKYISQYFRSVEWEQDYVSGTVPFISYNTGNLPQPAGSAARTLTVTQAFREAGIDLFAAGNVNAIDTSLAGANAGWDDAELHAAMVSNFSLWTDQPQWKVYMLVASAHEGGYRGIMFDYSGNYQRQGAAVFYNAIQGTDAARQRAQLRTYVHELGHAFNLMHSWQKNLGNPPAPLGPNSGYGDLSWMNYVQNFIPGGETGYWTNFPFTFTDNELIHLRHAYYRNIVFGGNSFGTGAAEVDPEMFSERIEDHSGLKLELNLPRSSYALGEPVVVEIKLSTTDTRGKRVQNYLHPNDSFVEIAIRQPSGKVVRYRPMIEHCVDEEKTTRLSPDIPPAYDSAYIGYGKDGFYFDQPGVYQLKANYTSLDGSKIVSSVASLRIRTPITAAESDIADLYLGDEQGQLFYLLGSDLKTLKSGNDALEEVVDRFPRQPLSVYARLVKGINAERDFKLLEPEKSLSLRMADPTESVKMLTSVVDSSVGERGVDNITLNMTMRHLASAQVKAGDMELASDTLDRMTDVFKKKKLNPLVLNQISAQVALEKRFLNLSKNG